MPYRYLLFDLDGTLFDFDAAERHALQTIFNEFGLEYHNSIIDDYHTINKKLWQDYELGLITPTDIKTQRFAGLGEKHNLQLDAEKAGKRYLEILATCTELIDGCEELLNQTSPDHHIAIITNGLKEVQRPRIAASPMSRYFDSVTISGEAGFAKPDPRIFDYAFAQMGNPAKESVLLIGDSLSSDITGGVSYGVDTCWYNPAGTANPDGPAARFEIRTLQELTNILHGKQQS
jgi:2-haloacid dehalogenase